MKNPIFLFILSSLLVLNTFAQDKLLTATDAIYMNRDIYPAHIPQIQWIGQSDDYAYAKENSFYKVSAKRGTETVLLDLDMLNNGMHANSLDSLKRLPSMTFYSDEAGYFKTNNTFYEYNFRIHELKKINVVPDTAENVTFNKTPEKVAFTIKNNLYYAEKGMIKQITSDTDQGIVNGQTVHRNEFGIDGGIFWSPDNNKLAFYRKDETMVTDYPLVEITTRIATVKNTKYPMAGETSEQVTLGIYDLAKGTTTYMKTGEPKDHYLTSVTWGPNEKYIYIAILNRDQNDLKLNQYDAETGEMVKTLFEETDPKYVEPETPLYFLPDHLDEFIWLSERDGFNHLYLYNTNGELQKQLTHGNWAVTEFLGFSGKETAWFNSTEASPLQNNTYSVNLKNDKLTRITPDHGTHHTMISKDGKYVIDAYSNTDVSREYKLLNDKGKTNRILKKDNNPLADYNLGKTTIGTLKADDGTELYYRLIKPINFDSTKKYPVIVYVYGGPHAQLVTDSWLAGGGLFLNYLAEQGYVIFTLDNRGSANRGRDFEQAIFRHVGDVEVKDQMVGVNYLKSLPYVDPDRIGVDGWSYGGFMTISLMLREPGVFKVAVAGGPVTDWKYYEVMYGERYMDKPQDNPEGYKNASLINKIDQLKGKLLIIHGTMDPTVVWQQSLLLLQEAIKKQKQVDYFVFPGHEHNVRGIDRAYLYEKIADYFKDNL